MKNALITLELNPPHPSRHYVICVQPLWHKMVRAIPFEILRRAEWEKNVGGGRPKTCNMWGSPKNSPNLDSRIKVEVIFFHFYRPRSEGDNVLGSARPSVRPSVCMSELSCLNRLTLLCPLRTLMDRQTDRRMGATNSTISLTSRSININFS